MYHKFVSVLFYIALLLTGASFKSNAQAPVLSADTLRLTLQQSEDLFIKNNLNLIAERYNIANAEAEIITQKLFNNPNLSFQHVLYNPSDKKIFEFGSEGQFQADFSQLITTAGKRNKNIRLATISAQQAQNQFFDLLRTLKYTLRTDFFQIYFQEQSAKVYNNEINSLSKTLVAFEEQYAKGNIAQKEVLRIKSQLYTLQTELATLQGNIDDVQSELKLLIKAQPDAYVSAVYDPEAVGMGNLEKVSYKQLQDSADVNRPDLKSARTAIEYSDSNLKLQKAIAVPDVNLMAGYDKQGSYIHDYNYVGISLPIPFFNRNQGAIKQARIAIDASKTALQLQQNQVQSQLDNSYKSAARLEHLANSFDPKFSADFNRLIQEVYKNYQKRNISLLEFLDFYESYKTNTINLNTLMQNRAASLEQLNFVTGTPFFNK